jgi:osmotically-inducible protein OsmY
MVKTEDAKDRAEQDAKKIDGVREVHNKIKVPE